MLGGLTIIYFHKVLNLRHPTVPIRATVQFVVRSVGKLVTIHLWLGILSHKNEYTSAAGDLLSSFVTVCE